MGQPAEKGAPPPRAPPPRPPPPPAAAAPVLGCRTDTTTKSAHTRWLSNVEFTAGMMSMMSSGT